MRVSKNNIKNKLSQSATRTQHFSIRKLSIGAASVLLSTSLYFGLSGHESVFADSSVGTTQSQSSSSSDSTSSTESSSSSESTTSSAQSSSSTNSTSSESSSSQSSSTSVNTTSSSEDNKTNNDSTATTLNVVDSAKSSSTSTLTESKVASSNALDSNTTAFTADKNTIGNDGTSKGITLTLNYTANAGDVITIKIPKSSVYKIGTGDFESLNGTGTTSFNSNGDYYVITDKITQDGAQFTQHINLSPLSNYYQQPFLGTSITNSAPITDVGARDLQALLTIVDKNGNQVGSKTIDYKSIISPQMHPSFGRKPTSTEVPSVLPKTDYTYYLKVGEANGVQDGTSFQSTLINSAVNFGSTITIPVPEGFVLDQTATNDKNNFADGTTITQSGNVITITVPKGAGNQGFQSTYPDGYAIVGYYNIDEPEEDTTIKASGDITITQKVDANGTEITSSLPTWTETLRGAKNTSVYGKFGSSAAANSSTGELLIDGDSGRIASFGFTNNTAFALSKAELTIKMADGLLTTSISTPAKSGDLEGLTSYTYTVTYTDGTTATGSVNAGDTVTAENGKYISQIVFNPNYIPAGASAQASSYDTNKLQFVAYGTVSTKYQDGTSTKAGDKLNSTITVTSPEIKNENGAQVFTSSTATNVLINQSGLTTSNNFYIYQGDQKAASNAGFVATYNSGASKTVNYAKDPIIYYVLPEGTVFNGTLENVQGSPKVSTFWVGNQQVIKFDYTGTNFKYDTTQTTNWAHLSILPTATSGTYPIVGYMTTSTGMNSASNPAVSTIQGFNSAFTEGNVENTYQIGKGTWTINLASEIYPAGLAKGNKDTNYSSTGTSDDKGSTELNYEVEVVNGTKGAQSATASDVHLYINLPTEVSFKLTGPISSNNNGETILYSTSAVTLGTTSQPDTSNWLTADQVTDWSTIKAIAIKIPQITANSNSGLYKITGIDSNLAADAGKTAYLEFESYRGDDDIPSVVQKGADSFAPAITISGTSTIKTALQYIDADGQTHTVNLNYTKQYQDNSSTMNYSDFPSAVTGFGSEDQATINALIAKGYKFVPLSDSNNTIVDNGGKTWQSDSPDGSAAWDSQVKYYFDGDTVVYKLEHNTVDVTPNDGKSSTDKIPNSNKNYPDGVTNEDLTTTVTRTINIHNVDGTTTPITQDVKFKRTAYVDAVTGKITGYSDYSSFDDNNGQYAEQGFDTLTGYTSHVTYANLKSTEDGATAVNTESALVNKEPTDETVDVTFTPNKETVNVKYVDQNGKELAPSESKSGDYGTSYETSAKTITGYHLTNTPANATGTFGTTNADVVYTYARDNETVNVKYVDQNGKEIASSDSKNGDYGTTYTTSAKTIDGYHLTNTPANATGTFNTTNADVVYTYAADKQQITIVVTDSSTGEKVNVPIPTDVATTTFTGNSNSEVPANVSTNVDKVKEYLKSKGYTVPEAITIPTTFDSTPNGTSDTDTNPQIITIEVGHNHTTSNKTITKTITYKTDDNQTVAQDYTQSVTIHKDTDDVTGTTTYSVDGKTLQDGSTTLGSQSLPSKDGYYAATVPEGATSDSTVNFDSSNVNVDVVYKKLGKIIPVDESGKEIPGADTPTYNNNSDDPTKAGDTTTPTVPGYTATKTTVPGSEITDPGEDTKVTYTANPQTITIKYVDDDNNGAQVGSDQSVSGKTGETVTPTYTIPAGYNYVSGEEESHTMTPDDKTVITVHLKHKTTIVTPDTDTTKTLPDNPTKNYPSIDALTKTVTRTINVHNTDGTVTHETQQVKFTRTATVDEATGEVTGYGNWTVDTSDNKPSEFEAYNYTTPSGYTSKVAYNTTEDKAQAGNGTVAKADASTTTDNETTPVEGGTVDVYFVPEKQTITVTVTDQDRNPVVIPTDIPTIFNGTTNSKVGTDVTDGVTNITTYLTQHGYEITNQSETPKNFDDTDNTGKDSDQTPQNIAITVKHKTVDVTPDKPKTTTDNLPDNPDTKYPSGVSETDLNKTITRTIVEVDQVTGEKKTVATQTVHYTRTATVDEVTGKVTYTDWSTTDKWSSYTATDKPGYTPSQKSVDETTPLVTDKDQTVTITYSANPTNTNVVFVDDNDGGKPVKTVPVNGVTGGTTPLSSDDQKIPDGYELVDGNKVPTEITFNNDGSQTPDTTVHLKHKTTTVTPDSPKTTDDNLPDNPDKKYPSGVSDTDLNKTITRTIVEVDPLTGEKKTVATQTVHYTRTATVDEVTGNVTYSDWTTTNNTWPEYTASKKTFFTPSQEKVSSQEVPVTGKDTTVTITYTLNPDGDPNFNFFFYDGGDSSETPIISGKIPVKEVDGKVVIDTDKIKSEIPKGYELIPDKTIPTDPATLEKTSDGTYKLPIPLQHKTTTVTPENPARPGDKLPDNPDKTYPDGVETTKTITRTINVHKPDGTTETTTQTVTFTRTVTVDEATGKVISSTSWTSTNPDYPEYTVPSIDGYTPSQTTVEKVTPKDTDSDSTVDVTYTGNTQTIKVVVVDKTTGKEVTVDVPTTFNGTSDQKVGTDVTDGVEKIKDFLKQKGYSVLDKIEIPTAFDHS